MTHATFAARLAALNETKANGMTKERDVLTKGRVYKV